MRPVRTRRGLPTGEGGPMMEFPDLPRFDIPEHKPKVPPPEVLHDWMLANLQFLRESGRLARIRRQASRRPAAARFAL